MLLAKMGRDTWFNARGGSISQSDANGGHSYVLVLSMAGSHENMFCFVLKNENHLVLCCF